MRPYPLIVLTAAGLLAGCTPFLEDLNANLKQVNAGLKQANAGRRGGGANATATADADVCDPVAFKAGFEDYYVADWNHTIGDKEGLYRYLSQQRPHDAAVRHNYALYRGKRLSGKGIGRPMEYRLRFDDQGRILNHCQANSYLKGEGAGIEAAARDIKALTDQEIEIAQR